MVKSKNKKNKSLFYKITEFTERYNEIKIWQKILFLFGVFFTSIFFSPIIYLFPLFVLIEIYFKLSDINKKGVLILSFLLLFILIYSLTMIFSGSIGFLSCDINKHPGFWSNCDLDLKMSKIWGEYSSFTEAKEPIYFYTILMSNIFPLFITIILFLIIQSVQILSGKKNFLKKLFLNIFSIFFIFALFTYSTNTYGAEVEGSSGLLFIFALLIFVLFYILKYIKSIMEEKSIISKSKKMEFLIYTSFFIIILFLSFKFSSFLFIPSLYHSPLTFPNVIIILFFLRLFLGRFKWIKYLKKL